MRRRGMFDLGGSGDMDWFTSFRRSSLVDALRPRERCISVNRPTDDPVWWDHVRARAGSPFIPGFRSRYKTALRAIKE